MATIHPEQLQHLNLVDRPALGAFVGTAAVIERRQRARWVMQMSFTDYVARRRTLTNLVTIHEAVRLGRRLDLAAEDLRSLADDLDAIPQPRTGGWPIREAA